MEQAEIERGEAAAFQQCDRDRIAQRQLHQRRRCGREVVRAGFARLRQHERDVGGLAERAAGLRRDRDQRAAEAARIVDQVFQFSGFA